jgi:hypothetical protein
MSTAIKGPPKGWMDERGWLISQDCKVKYHKHYSTLQAGYTTPVYTADQLGGVPEKTGAQMEAELEAADTPEPAHRAALRASPHGAVLLEGLRYEADKPRAESGGADLTPVKPSVSELGKIKAGSFHDNALKDRLMLLKVLEELKAMTHFCDACDEPHNLDGWDVVKMLKEHLK